MQQAYALRIYEPRHTSMPQILRSTGPRLVIYMWRFWRLHLLQQETEVSKQFTEHTAVMASIVKKMCEEAQTSHALRVKKVLNFERKAKIQYL